MVLVLLDLLNSEAAADLCSRLRQGQEAEAAALLTQHLGSHPLFLLAVQPHSLSQPDFRRHEEEAGEVAEALVGVGGSRRIRADVGVTVFLSDPSSYQGGELVLDRGWGDESIKEGAGACVLYPASARRRFARVTQGSPWLAQLWAQSLVRDPARREILYDIGYSLHLLDLFGRGQGAQEVDRLNKCQRNLLRLWTEP
jgi:PKHD-type hydroxylase